MVDDVSTLQQLKVALDITKTLMPLLRKAKSKGLDDQHADELSDAIAEMQTALFGAQQDALDAQRVQFEQSARIRELEQTIAGFEDWESEKARYELVNASQLAGFVYLLRKEAAHENEPLHYICPKCYHHKIKSIIQRIRIGGRMQDICPECKTTFTIHHDIARSHGVYKYK